MKKILALVIALLLSLTLCGTAFSTNYHHGRTKNFYGSWNSCDSYTFSKAGERKVQGSVREEIPVNLSYTLSFKYGVRTAYANSFVSSSTCTKSRSNTSMSQLKYAPGPNASYYNGANYEYQFQQGQIYSYKWDVKNVPSSVKVFLNFGVEI